MVKCYRKSVNGSDLWVSTHDRLSDFYASSWQRGDSAVPMLVMRIILLIIGLMILAWALYEGGNVYWLLFLTNWGLVVLNACLFNGVIVSLMRVCKILPESLMYDELPWYVSTYWFLFNVSISVAFTISALYWILLYNPEMKVMTPNEFWFDVATHGVNSCLAFAEVALSRTPIRLLHFYQPLGVGLWYAAFTAVYYLAGGTDPNGLPFIYEVLDWRYGKRAGLIVGISAVGMLFIYLGLYTLGLLRDKVTVALIRTTSVELANAPPDHHMANGIA